MPEHVREELDLIWWRQIGKKTVLDVFRKTYPAVDPKMCLVKRENMGYSIALLLVDGLPKFKPDIEIQRALGLTTRRRFHELKTFQHFKDAHDYLYRNYAKIYDTFMYWTIDAFATGEYKNGDPR